MLRYVDTETVFSEVPDEISLAVNISGCPLHCFGCHSPHLWEDVGDILDEGSLEKEISSADGITCLCLLGGDGDTATITRLLKATKQGHPQLKTCWYSGRGLEEARTVTPYLDYIKVGPFIKALGGLKSPDTNQRLYKIHHSNEDIRLEDITYRLRKGPDI